MTKEKRKLLPENIQIYVTGEDTRTAHIQLTFNLKQSPVLTKLSDGWRDDPFKLEQVEAQALVVELEKLTANICSRGFIHAMTQLLEKFDVPAQ